MKNIFSLFFCSVLCIALAACSTLQTSASVTDDELTQDLLIESEIEIDAAQTLTEEDVDTSLAQTQASTVLSVAYSSKGHNPYLTTDTLVEQTTSLLFENFIDISPDFEIDYRLAQEIVCEGYTVTITLRSNCSFADGTPITTEDALQSLQTAMASDTYRARFSNVQSAIATDTQIILTLASPDSLFAYLLDIPILKADELASTTPTASGRYTLSSNQTYLIKNPYATFASDGPDEITLIYVASYDEMINALTLGDINYTVQSEASASESSSISFSEHYYKTNTLLFLGVNSYAKNPLCNTAEGRILLSELLDRETLVTNTYNARAYAAYGALNSFYPVAKDSQSFSSSTNDASLTDTMGLLGYTYSDETGLYQTEAGEVARISILLYSSNSYKTMLTSEIAATWAKYGIETTIITASDFNSFLTLLESNEFELYIGEMKLYNNIELSSFWGGSASYGIQASDTLLGSYTAFRSDASLASAFEQAFADEMPYIPILWRNGIVLTSRNTIGVSASTSNPFYALENLTFFGS